MNKETYVKRPMEKMFLRHNDDEHLIDSFVDNPWQRLLMKYHLHVVNFYWGFSLAIEKIVSTEEIDATGKRFRQLTLFMIYSFNFSFRTQSIC